MRHKTWKMDDDGGWGMGDGREKLEAAFQNDRSASLLIKAALLTSLLPSVLSFSFAASDLGH